MPTPSWTFSYNMAQTPEQNGFTRLNQSPPMPVINLVTGGNPANRRIEVTTIAANPDQGIQANDIVFLINNIPNFDVAIGMTAEALLSVSGVGDVGFEARFIGIAISVSIFQDRVRLEAPWLSTVPTYIEAPTLPNDVNVLWRTTFDGADARIYRAGVLALGPVAIPLRVAALPQSNFMFWFENGGTGIIKAMNFFIGGAVVP